MKPETYNKIAIAFWNSLRKEDKLAVAKLKDQDDIIQYLEDHQQSMWNNFVGDSTAFSHIEDNRPTISRSRYDEDELEYFRDLYEQGLSTKDIVTEFVTKYNRTPSAARTKFYRIRKSF